MSTMSTPAGPSRLRATGRVRRRKRVNRAIELLATAASASAVIVLGIMVGSVAYRGAPALNWDFFTKSTVTFGAGGGIANALVGSLLLVLMAAAMAIPIGVLIAIYVGEFSRPKVGLFIRTTLDVLNGVPSIVIGIFIYVLLVISHKQSAFVASVALAIIMLPLIARSTQEMLTLVPESLRHASLALGVSKWRTVLRIVLPTTIGGIMTGATLAVARAAGETAPLLFTTTFFLNQVSWDPSKPVASIPFVIYTYSESADPVQHQQAWAAAFVLIMFVLVTSLTSRFILHRSRRKLLTGRSGRGVIGLLRSFWVRGD